jgi:glutamate formiminotransferase
MDLMARKLVECVPNFSEGRDAGKIDAIVRSVLSVPGVAVLDREADADHNRSVITFVGSPDAVAESAFRAVETAASLIDLTQHRGAHPRIGAADVVPFVPVEGITLDECVRLAERVGQEIWQRLHIPVYFYEAAAKRPERMNLENIRRGQFEGLRQEIGSVEARRPDIGDPACHPTAGAVAVGARKFLIAYNINLGTSDVEIAKRIAKIIRFSSGGFPYVKAMGVMLESRNLARVSMNLTDFEQTPLHVVFDAVRREAEKAGVGVVGSEIIGLIPRKAIELAAAHFAQFENFRPEMILENRIADAMAAASTGLEGFLDALAAPTATPGGGSAAAAGAAMAAALGSMVTRLAKQESAAFEEDRAFFTAAVERDAAAFRSVMAAYKRPAAERAPYIEEALHGAAEVPMQVLERVSALITRLGALEIPARFGSDLAVAQALAEAARAGALENVHINLDSIQDAGFKSSIEARLRAIGC